MRPLRFGICTDQNIGWEENVERWRRFDELGFDSAWDCDHWIQPSRPTGPYFEAWTLLAALAARTERIRVGVLVSSNTFRHPAWLAKQAATVDRFPTGGWSSASAQAGTCPSTRCSGSTSRSRGS